MINLIKNFEKLTKNDVDKFGILPLFSKDYILPGSIVKEFLILDNWIEVILDIKFFFYILGVSEICYFIEICHDKLPNLFLGEDSIYGFIKRSLGHGAGILQKANILHSL